MMRDSSSELRDIVVYPTIFGVATCVMWVWWSGWWWPWALVTGWFVGAWAGGIFALCLNAVLHDNRSN